MFFFFFCSERVIYLTVGCSSSPSLMALNDSNTNELFLIVIGMMTSCIENNDIMLLE